MSCLGRLLRLGLVLGLRWRLVLSLGGLGGWVPLVSGRGETLLRGKGDRGELIRVVGQLGHDVVQLLHQDRSVLLC